jgi:hypothetical protein
MVRGSTPSRDVCSESVGLRSLRPLARGTRPIAYQPTVTTGSFPASHLIKVAAEAGANWSAECGPAEGGIVLA